ncbi:hypothetical protein QT970_01580 [Microcoleus sp. herbarium8]|uniref:hypothetical protein n=1 Tax=Microcoleus sp. herbarium8 TaxID=3055436 RepID=UPI002FD3154A
MVTLIPHINDSSLCLTIVIIITHLYPDDRLAIGVEEGIGRSPLKSNTKHCDDCTECDRPSRQIPNTAMIVRSTRVRSYPVGNRPFTPNTFWLQLQYNE